MVGIGQKEYNQVSKANLVLNRNLLFIRIIAFVAVIAIGTAFFILPKLIKNNEDRQGELKNKSEKLADLENYVTSLQALSSAEENFGQSQSANLQLLSQVLPPVKDLANLIAQMEAITRVSGFTLNSLSITENGVDQSAAADASEDGTSAPEPAGGTLRSLNINLSLSGGGYDTFKDLLENLERHIRLLDVNSISFSNPDETGSYTLTLTTYYYLEDGNQQ